MPYPNSARERSVTIGFRVAPEQARHIDLMARVCKMLRDEIERADPSVSRVWSSSDGCSALSKRFPLPPQSGTLQSL